MIAVIVFVAFSLVGWILLLVSFTSRRAWLRKEERERSRTGGTIVEYVRQRVRSGRSHRTIWLPVVRFDAEGQEYQLKYDYSIDREAFPVGQSVEVLYDPDDPARFHLDEGDAPERGFRLSLRISVIWILCAAILAGAVAYIPASRFDGLQQALRGLSGRGKSRQETAYDDFSYKLSDKGLATITNYKGKAEALTLPMMVDGHLVEGMIGAVFTRCDSLRSVTVPGLYFKIPTGAFAGCLRLTEVTLQSGVHAIDSMAFVGCLSLMDVTLPASVESIAKDAFPEDCMATFHVPAGSEAERYCTERGFRALPVEAE